MEDVWSTSHNFTTHNWEYAAGEKVDDKYCQGVNGCCQFGLSYTCCYNH